MRRYSYDASGNLAGSEAAGVTVQQIIGYPVAQMGEPGDFATFSVVVSNASGVTFQWTLNGTIIPGSMGDSLLLTEAGAANVGEYSVAATNTAGSVISAPAAPLRDSDGGGLPDSWEIVPVCPKPPFVCINGHELDWKD